MPDMNLQNFLMYSKVINLQNFIFLEICSCSEKDEWMNELMKKMAVTWVDKNESFFKRTHKKSNGIHSLSMWNNININECR